MLATAPLCAAELDAELFASHVTVDPASSCHLWTSRIDRYGYGQFWVRPPVSRTISAHRAAWVLAGHIFRPGQVIDHLCRNRACVNPDHLEATTVQVNTARGEGPTAAAAAARLDGRCVNGHDLAEVGVHRQRDGVTCAECGRERVRRYAARRKAAA